MIARLLLASGLALGGATLGVAIAAAQDDVYRATALVQVLPAAETMLSPARRLTVEVQAASYTTLVRSRSFLEQVRPQLAGGRLATEELLERVEARHEAGTALIELRTEAPTPAGARGLASDLAGALVGYVQQQERQRVTQLEDELRREIAELNDRIARAAARPAELEALREERAELNRQLATAAAEGVDRGTRVVVAGAPATDPDPESPSEALWGLLGAATGLAVGLLAVLVAAVRPRAVERLPAPVSEPEPVPHVVEPGAGAILTGTAPVRTEPADAAAEWSLDGRAWNPVGEALDTTALADGPYLLRISGSDQALPVEVDNTPPVVSLAAPEEAWGPILLRAEASDEGSGVASVEFMLSDGSAEWRTIAAGPEAQWDPRPLPPGLYWLCAVARDRAGLPAASEPKALHVRS